MEEYRKVLQELIDRMKPYTLYGSEKTINQIKQLDDLPDNVKFQSHPYFEDGKVYLIATPIDKPLKIWFPN